VTALCFNENGYQLASCGADDTVKIWDLRKLKCTQEIQLPTHHHAHTVAFDNSGTFLAVGANDIRTYMVKQWDVLSTLTQHSKAVKALAWSANASQLISAGGDNSIRVFGQ
jgi:WD40 repeat protein